MKSLGCLLLVCRAGVVGLRGRSRSGLLTSGLCVLFSIPAAAQFNGPILEAVRYENRLYVPAPDTNAFPNATVTQSRHVVTLNGNIGATNHPITAFRPPSNGTQFLARSIIGQPVAPPAHPNVYFGDEFKPDPNLEVDLTIEPVISDTNRAFWIREGKVFGAGPGFVEITWYRLNGDPVGPIRYLVAPITNPTGTPPVALYHTHKPDANLLSGIPNAVPAPPSVNLSGVASVKIHWNEFISEDPVNPVFYLNAARVLYARLARGLILLEYRNAAGAFLGIEKVVVRSNEEPEEFSAADIGSELQPVIAFASQTKPHVSKGLATGGAGADAFVYQHNVGNSPQDGDVFAIRKSLSGQDIEIYWRRRGVSNLVEWPYELHRYWADWPSNPGKYQAYVRAAPPVIGPNVIIPPSITAELMPWAEPAGHAQLVSAQFHSAEPGWSLLKYTVANSVSFQVVRSILNTASAAGAAGGRLAAAGASPFSWPIGYEITEATHQGPRPGYIHAPRGDRYDWEIYDGRPDDPPEFRTRQIFAVNTGELEIWWSNLNQGVQWPSRVRRYVTYWPEEPKVMVIASQRGTGEFNPVTHRNVRIYYQNDPNLPGYNPNDEHALTRPVGDGEAVFALRSDLGTPETSEPYVLVKYQDPQDGNRWKYDVFAVIAEGSDGDNFYTFEYPINAGLLIQPPFPLNTFQTATNNRGVSGPFWRDRKNGHWAKAAGDNGGPTNLVMRFFYHVQPGFFFPDVQPTVGDEVPWLDRYPGTPGTPMNITYRVSWPSSVPSLRVGETLVKPKFGLPDIGSQISAEILYQQSAVNGAGPSVQLIDPTRVHEQPLETLVVDTGRVQSGGNVYFPALPPSLRTNFWYDPLERKLKFSGAVLESPGVEDLYFVRLNVLSLQEKTRLLSLSTDAAYQAAVNALSAKANQVIGVPPNTPFYAPLALTAGQAQGVGFVTLAFNNSTNLNEPGDPISLAILRVTCPIYRGDLKVILSDNPLDEKVTVRHSGDFAGRPEDYVFEWRTKPPLDGLPPVPPFDSWPVFVPNPSSGEGAMSITIEGSGLFTLTDNYFICRYRPKNPGACGTNASGWTEPMLVEGWIKRVLAGIDPFEQRIKNYENSQVNTIVSMISQAGPRYVGDIALNLDAVNRSGLIEIYETVLKRGMEFSIDGAPPVTDYTPANQALLLAAGRLADLYMLLGNEAFADAADPTIAFGTEDGNYGAEASSLHCFMNQTGSLLEEELALLRGRDNRLPPGVQIYPFYNRLIWNFTRDIVGGEVAYALNYNIRPPAGPVSGTTDEASARLLYPQGHGDAWGHYLTGIKNYYRLLRHPRYSWQPQVESILVGGVPVAVDYLDERKFAQAAGAKARTGAEIVNLTYRQFYVEDANGQWQGYQDTTTDRAWGVSEWASRAGQGAYFDWVVGNALLPDVDPNTNHVGIQKIDRTTVTELRDIAATFDVIQDQLEKANSGLNPLGITQATIPFDISPTEIDQQKTHFEQIYDRAVVAMNNAIAVFNHANNSTQLLRRQADSLDDFQRNVVEREADFNNRLIEIYGTPYEPDDVGRTGAYPQGYTGPDLVHFNYIDAFELTGVPSPTNQTWQTRLREFQVDPSGGVQRTTNTVTFHVDGTSLTATKPAPWTGRRRAPGEIQRSLSELLQARVRFERGLREYDLLLADIEDRADLLARHHGLDLSEIRVLRANRKDEKELNAQISELREVQLIARRMAQYTLVGGEVMAEYLPTSSGTASDLTSAQRGQLRSLGAAFAQIHETYADIKSFEELGVQQAKEDAQNLANINVTTIRQNKEINAEIAQLEQTIRQEALLRYELYNLREALAQAAGNYRSTLAHGLRLLEDRLRFRQQTAAQVQSYRYKDMAFRIFRNDALQKYRAQFDLATMYVYLAARTYDYETALLPIDSKAGEHFMTSIVRARSLGQIGSDGHPRTGSGIGDAGLADPMARMFENWSLVLRGRLAFNNPQAETGRFSIRQELFRVQTNAAIATASAVWREILARHVVSNLFDIPEFRRYCIPFSPANPVEPGIVIPFETTINFGQNLFGWPLGGGDNAYDSSHFATKIRSVGVWFANFNNTILNNAPRIYLVPVGNDYLRSPSDISGEPRAWKVFDQALPVPFPIGPGDLGSLNWIPAIDTLSEELGSVRRFGSLRAYHDSGNFNANETINNSRLIGRSVWNSRWLLIIPAGTLLADRTEGLARFIYGPVGGTGQRTGNGVTDIKIFFQTYAYQGEVH